MKALNYDCKKNIEYSFSKKDLVWLDAKCTPFSLHGVYYDESIVSYTRLPRDVAQSVSADVSWLSLQSGGGRLRFVTDSEYVAIHAVLSTVDEKLLPHKTVCSFDLYKYYNEYKKMTYVYTAAPKEPFKNIISDYFKEATGRGMETYELYFPNIWNVKELYIGLSPEADITAPDSYKHEKPVVFYGSSITQGVGASRSGNSYESFICRHLDLDFINLGFAGAAKGEAAMAEYIAKLDMSAFVFDYDHNAPSNDHLRDTHEKFFKKIREAHPTLPIVIMTAPNTMPHYDWHRARQDIIRRTYENALSNGDENVYFINGDELFEGDDRDACTTDTCHPNDLGMIRMAKRVEKEFQKFLK